MKVALVEHSRTVRRIVGDMIRSAGHEVVAVGDAATAFAAVMGDPAVRAVLASFELEGRSGADLCADLRKAAGRTRPLYVTLMSSDTEYGKCVKALDNGADDFIRKPIVAEELLAKLRVAERVTALQGDLVRLATTDGLTGLSNRRAFFEEAARAVHLAEQGARTSVVLIDLDQFKRINDTYGHEGGDEVLRCFSREASKLGGMPCRLGGEEFAILLECGLEDAVEAAEEMRRSFDASSVRVGDRFVRAACSVGVAEWQQGEKLDDMLRRADAALYRAKNEGRNRVVAAEPDMEQAAVMGFRSPA